ncbi:hypothetical protein [Paenibacillus periandrae]|uniref:hypothetical protein n=1 Tax=Paenibacillus periandrae TaxID=1761741 RepID=UPI001F0929A9|nr:hypothetical protein [Paenibacillus periandrae]
MTITVENIDSLIHRMYRLFILSKSEMEKDELGLKLRELMNKRKELVKTVN